MRTALVLGAGGFIGSHMVRRLKSEGFWVRGVDLKKPDFSLTLADEFVLGDLRDQYFVDQIIRSNNSIINFDEIYQFAADMGGAGFIFTGAHDADIMHNSASINLNILDSLLKLNMQSKANHTKILFASSACIYPAYNQEDTNNPICAENSAYPAAPDSEYGWEKLFSERLFFAYERNHGIRVRIARYHNIFGPEGTWDGGREKAPAAICRKVSLANDFDEIEIWGDGNQTRSFLYIDECIEATRLLMNHESFSGPINIGSEEMVTINELVEIATKISGKTIRKNYISGPLGVRGRNSDNTLIREILGWDCQQKLSTGIEKTYNWISEQLALSSTGSEVG
jgi:nucleoside-diphosphate-sugar epimerase